MVRVRFAPSPTGPLHIGGVRTALFNYLFAKSKGGKIILRIEDTDQTRYVQGAEEYIIEALEWCGIKFDEGIRESGQFAPYRQSDRKEIYNEYVKILIDNKLAYYAFDTPEDLESLRKNYEIENKVFTYNYMTRKNLNNSLNISKEELEKKFSNNESYVIRFKIPENQNIEVYDEIRGKVSFQSNELDDKVLMKADGLPTYHLANIVDDHLMEITHVIRGEEWLPSMPLHILLYKAFQWEAPKFAHLPLILKPSGKGKLSKRDGDQMGFPVFPIQWKNENEVFRGYREDGYFSEAFINMLALLGWNPGTEKEIFTINELIEIFTLDRVGKSPSRFDPDKTKWFNHQYIMQKSDKDIADLFMPILSAKNINIEYDKLLIICANVKERVNFVHEIWDNAIFFFENPKVYDEKFVKKNFTDNSILILNELVNELEKNNDYKASVIEEIIKSYSESKELNIGKLMPLLRLALVGEAKGPSIFIIAEVIGKQATINRIQQLIKFLTK